MRHHRRPRRSLLAALACLLLGASDSRAEVPAEGSCPTVTPLATGGAPLEDAVPVALEPGMVLVQDDLMVIRQLVPQEIWRYREIFFYEGMRMQIGACNRRYAPPRFFRDATEAFAGSAQLDPAGNLRGYRAGVPFPPDRIEAEDPLAGARWAWNLEMRYRGAGYRGQFRIVDMPSSLGGIETYTGDFFLIQTRHRSDLASTDYQLPGAGDMRWASGGAFKTPFNARHVAWRQFRPLTSLRRHREPDDTFVYLPSMRKMRRAATSWIDGVYLPRYSATGEGGGGGLALGGAAGAINPTAGQSIAISEHTPRGFAGLSFRPNAYVWRVLGERTVLAPLNASRVGYPTNPGRNFGPSGLSFASDRWDIRYAVVIEGALRIPGQGVHTLTIYVDYDTLQPLYWISRTQRRRLLEVGLLVHRYSGDRPDYPDWPGGTAANAFDPVAASFFNAIEGRGGWRRESYDLLSTPFPEKKRRGLLTSNSLVRGH